MDIKEINVPVISFKEMVDAYVQAMIEFCENEPDKSYLFNIFVRGGIPKFDEDNLKPFLEWSFCQLSPDLPERYFVQTKDGVWAVSGSDCLVWSLGKLESK